MIAGPDGMRPTRLSRCWYADKPHIHLAGRFWVCVGQAWRSTGTSMQAAYAGWRLYVETRDGA